MVKAIVGFHHNTTTTVWQNELPPPPPTHRLVGHFCLTFVESLCAFLYPLQVQRIVLHSVLDGFQAGNTLHCLISHEGSLLRSPGSQHR